MKTEITDFGRQRRALLKFSAISLLAAGCSASPTAIPARKTEFRVYPNQTEATPYLTITNNTRYPIVFDSARFPFPINECFIEQPGLLYRIKPGEITTVLETGSILNEYEPPFRMVRKMEGNTHVFLATDSYAEVFNTERSLDPLGTLSSEMLSHLFIAGVFCWARRRNICEDQQWTKIEESFFSTSRLLIGSMNFVGFLNLGQTA